MSIGLPTWATAAVASKEAAAMDRNIVIMDGLFDRDERWYGNEEIEMVQRRGYIAYSRAIMSITRKRHCNPRLTSAIRTFFNDFNDNLFRDIRNVPLSIVRKPLHFTRVLARLTLHPRRL